jgi:Sec7-like guanine-nucleotide exchange factor
MVRLLRFYPQYKIDDFLDMDMMTLCSLSTGMEKVMAMEQLLAMDYVSYPKSDEKSRRASHKKWYKLAYPESFENKVVKTTDLELF